MRGDLLHQILNCCAQSRELVSGTVIVLPVCAPVDRVSSNSHPGRSASVRRCKYREKHLSLIINLLTLLAP